MRIASGKTRTIFNCSLSFFILFFGISYLNHSNQIEAFSSLVSTRWERLIANNPTSDHVHINFSSKVKNSYPFSTILKSNTFDDVIRLNSPNSNIPLQEENDGSSETGNIPQTASSSSSTSSSSSSDFSSDSYTDDFANISATATTTTTKKKATKAKSISESNTDSNSISSSSSSSSPATTISTSDIERDATPKSLDDVNVIQDDSKEDSFRPSKEPLEPFIINLLIKIFESNEDAERVVNKALRARRRRYSKDLTLEDCKIIRKRVFGTVALQLRLAYILEKVVSKSGTLDQKFGFQLKEFGLPLPFHLTGKSNKKEVSKEEDDFMNTLYGTDEVKKGEEEGKAKDTKSKKKEDPMQLLHRAECLLAMYILTEESESKVEFIESDRLDILTKYLDVDEINTEDYYNDIEDPIERISKRHSMPEWIVQRYVEAFDSDGANSLCAALNQPSKTVVRINPEKSSRDKIARALLDSNNPTRMSLDFLKKSAARDSTAQKEKYTVPSLQFQPQSFSDMKFTDLDTSRTTTKNEAEDKESLEKIQAAKGTIYESLIQHKNNENDNNEDNNAAVSAEKKNSSPEEIQSKSKTVTLSETKYSPWGIVVENREVPLTSLELFERGYFDIMNEASQCSVLASGANPWDIVLMYGSKTGVKAHAMASLMRENGMVYCFEEYERQVHQLKSRIERFGTNEVMEIIPDVNAARRIRADLVFVDAICSNSGVFNHHPSIRYRKQEEDLYQTFIPKQKEMLMNAATAVTPGGLLVYTTCSLFREENEDIAEWFANSEAGADFEPEPFDAKGHMRLFAPHIHGSTMDGTFLCRWRRKQNEDA